LKGALLNIGFVFDSLYDAMAEVPACPGAGQGSRAPAIEWRISSGTLAGGQPVYRQITVEGDTTRGLTQDGTIRLRLPKSADDFGVFALSDADQLGTGDFPPALDEETEKRLLCWLYAFRPNGAPFGRLRHVAANATEVAQSKQALPEFLGTGNGQPGQRYRLVHGPVLAGTLKLEVEEVGRWVAWLEVDHFLASGAGDRHFVVDPEAGEVRFGNGLQGLPPQIGQRIRSREYRYGGGASGNVAPKAISKVVGVAGVKVTNPLRAYRGADAETVPEALTRIPGELRRRDRAVTAGDFQELARMTPGAAVGRAECLPRFYPAQPKREVPGAVSVVVWPREDPAHPNAPTPDRGLLRSVCEWLDERRLVTTELYVIPPTYRRVAVAVGLEVKPGYGIEAVRRWVELVLRQYLAPLPPYGPEGQGWPLGRLVQAPELEAAALQVEGVQFLRGMKVAGWDGTQWVKGQVVLEPYEVVELAEISVEDGPVTVEPGQQPAPPPLATLPVPIPILRYEC
jgi:hypothetical protein